MVIESAPLTGLTATPPDVTVSNPIFHYYPSLACHIIIRNSSLNFQPKNDNHRPRVDKQYNLVNRYHGNWFYLHICRFFPSVAFTPPRALLRPHRHLLSRSCSLHRTVFVDIFWRYDTPRRSRAVGRWKFAINSVFRIGFYRLGKWCCPSETRVCSRVSRFKCYPCVSISVTRSTPDRYQIASGTRERDPPT